MTSPFHAPYEDLPIEVRRRNWGWFGEPWPSGICYDDSGRLNAEMRKPVPVGENCLQCGEPIAEGHSGTAMPYQLLHEAGIGHVHKECMLRAVLGSVSCLTGEHNHDDGKSYRQQALEVWAYRVTGGFDAHL